MNLLSFSANDYEVQSTSNSSNDASQLYNNNIIIQSTNGTSNSQRSVSDTTIDPPNLLEAPINTSGITELQLMVQSLQMELATLRGQQTNLTSSIQVDSHQPQVSPRTNNNTTN